MLASASEYLCVCLVDEGAFKSPPDGPVDRRKLGQARCIMLLFYLGFGAVLASTVYCMFFTGRVEVSKTAYKQDSIEAPSVAVCPFVSGESIQYPEGDRAGAIEVFKYGVDGETRLKTTTHECVYDRICACVDLWQIRQAEVVNSTGFAGLVAKEPNGVYLHDHMRTKHDDRAAERVSERIQVRTSLADPSANQTLKIGLYDSADRLPHWFYMSQASYVIGSLELQTWTVSDLSFPALWRTLRGDYRATFSQRHIFRYISQEVGHRSGVGRVGTDAEGAALGSSHVSYEMQHFFVDDTLSSETAVSPYSLLFLCFLLVVRAAMREAFVNLVFPKWDPAASKQPLRELSWGAEALSRYCGCCVPACLGRQRADADVESTEPLLGQGDS